MKSLAWGWGCTMWRLVFLLCFLRGFGVKGITCEVQVYTSSVRFAGTDADVHIVLYGNKGTSKSILLDNGKNNFEKGKLDIFHVETDDIGELCSVIIGHNNKGVAAGWHLNQTRISCNQGSTFYTFLCDCWLSKNEGDRTLVKTINATHPCKKRITCEVQVYTSSVRFAGTDADVHIVLYGNKGTSKSIPLDNGKNNFEKGKLDSFHVETDVIGELCSVLIGHNNKGVAAGWHLNQTRISCNQGSTFYTFLCDCWLSKNEGDRTLVKTINATHPCKKIT